MAKPYLTKLETLLGSLPLDPGMISGISCRHFFSGAAAYAGGKIFMTWTPAGLALKLPRAERETLLTGGAELLQYFPKAPVKKEYVVVPELLLGEPQRLSELIVKSISFAASQG